MPPPAGPMREECLARQAALRQRLAAIGVFTAAPALCCDALRGGVRIERDYRITADGVERIPSFPMDL